MIKPVKRFVKVLVRLGGYEIVPSSTSRTIKEQNPDVSDREWRIYSRVQPLTMLSLERVLANIRAVDYVVDHNIPGDIVECGVWRGGSSLAMALALEGRPPRTLWMYDTYAGMTEPSAVDINNNLKLSASELLDGARRCEVPENSWMIALASLRDVRSNMESSGFPMESIRFIEGPVEQTIPQHIPERIAVLRIDTDWYESTLHEMVHLYPLLSPGGILMIDDYGCWQGSQKAVDEYFGSSGPFLNRIDTSGRLVVKP